MLSKVLFSTLAIYAWVAAAQDLLEIDELDEFDYDDLDE